MTKTKAPPAPVIGQRERELLGRIARTEAAIPLARENLDLAQRDARILIGSAKMAGGDRERAEAARETARRAQEDVEALEACVVAWREELPAARRQDDEDVARWRAYVDVAQEDIAAQVALQEAAEELGRRLRAFLTARARAANVPAVILPPDRASYMTVLAGGNATAPAAVAARVFIEGAIFDESGGAWPSPNPMWTTPGTFRRFEGTLPGSMAHVFARIAREYGAPEEVVAALTPSKTPAELGAATESFGGVATRPEAA
jgi:hypothetical protein